jgi:glutamate/tyrosine decarboxylase-like PLP-dependent enzyme
MPRMTHVGLVAYLHDLVREHPDFEVLCKPMADLYCFRYVPNDLSEHKDQPEVRQLLDNMNEELVESAQRESPALVTKIYIDGHIAIRMWIFADDGKEQVETTFEAIARWGRLCTKKHLVVS